MSAPRNRISVITSLLAMVCVLPLSALTGCRLCCDTGDLDYPAYGGSWERTRRDGGRVGSIFDPGGAKVANLTDREDVMEPDDRFQDDSQDASDESSDVDPGDAEDAESQRRNDELQQRIEEIRNQDLEDINVIPGEPMPPSVY